MFDDNFRRSMTNIAVLGMYAAAICLIITAIYYFFKGL